MWSQERQAWLDKPWMWKLWAFLSLPLLISAATALENNFWLAVVALLLAFADVAVAVVACRAARRT